MPTPADDRLPDFCHALGVGSTGVVSLVGAGGKTSLMYRLARESVDQGRVVLTATTTRIIVPSADQCESVVVSSCYDDLRFLLRAALRRHKHVTAAAGRGEGGKLLGFPAEVIDRLARERVFDRMIVEADGAARRPLKAPAEHEPVIPACSDRVVVVAGLSAIGLPLTEEVVFRSHRFGALASLEVNAVVGAAELAAVLKHPQGGLRSVPPGCPVAVFLNQADDPARAAAARDVCCHLARSNSLSIDRVASGRLTPPAAVKTFWVRERTYEK